MTLVFSLEEGGKVFHLNERGLVSSISKLFYAHKPLLLKASFCLIVSKTIGGIKVYVSPYYNRIHFPHMVTPSVTMCDMQQKLALSNPITFSHIALSHDFNSTSTPFVMINFIFLSLTLFSYEGSHLSFLVLKAQGRLSLLIMFALLFCQVFSYHNLVIESKV